jgi:hypothetical protein
VPGRRALIFDKNRQGRAKPSCDWSSTARLKGNSAEFNIPDSDWLFNYFDFTASWIRSSVMMQKHGDSCEDHGFGMVS